MNRIMAIDYGDKRVGIALTDPLKIVVSGYITLKNDKKLMNEIVKICNEKNVDKIVIGIPYNEEYKIGTSAKKIMDFVEKLDIFFKELSYNIEIYGEDERYTTTYANEILKELKVKNKRKKDVVDQIAASKMLTSFLNNKNRERLK